MAITSLRSDLFELTSTLISMINSRRDIVSSIQENKKTLNLGAFDVVREKTIFTNLKPKLVDFSNKELLALSLMIESQAGDLYPHWSEGEHLNEAAALIEQQINPVLLLILNPASFKMLDLKREYKEIINEG